MRNELEEYIAKVPAARRERFRRIVDVIHQTVPQAEMVIKYKMPTFQIGEKLLAVASQKNYISVYACSSNQIAAFKRKYPKIKTGNTCLNIKDADQFDLQDLAEITKAVFA